VARTEISLGFLAASIGVFTLVFVLLTKNAQRRWKPWLTGLAALLLAGAVISFIWPEGKSSESTGGAPSISVTGGSPGISVNQSGGVTAGTYINEAPKPELKTLSEHWTTNGNGTYTFERVVEMNAPYAGTMPVLITGKGLADASIGGVAKRTLPDGNVITISGTGMQTSYMVGKDFLSTTVQAPAGEYHIKATVTEKDSLKIKLSFE
jgi:hypothetical protein